MEKYRKEIENIRKILLDFYEKKFLSNEDEFLENKSNKRLVENLIINIYEDHSLSRDKKEMLLEHCLQLLAENTGCQEDEEILNDIVTNLEYHINSSSLSKFIENRSTNRWR